MRHCSLFTNHDYSYFNDGQFTSTGNDMMPGMLTRQNALVSVIRASLRVYSHGIWDEGITGHGEAGREV